MSGDVIGTINRPPDRNVDVVSSDRGRVGVGVGVGKMWEYVCVVANESGLLHRNER